MTPIEIDKALCDIAFNIINECKERIERADKTNKTEIKALKIEEGMYSLAPRAGLLFHAKSREGMLETRKNKVLPTILPRYPEIKALYESLDEDKKNIFVAALQAELFMRYSCYDNNLSKACVSEPVRNDSISGLSGLSSLQGTSLTASSAPKIPQNTARFRSKNFE